MQNGAASPDLDYEAVIDSTIIGLRQAVDAASRLAAVKRAEYEDAAAQAKRLTKALDALEPRAPKPATGKAVSDERIAAVFELIERIDRDEFTATDLVNLHGPGISIGTVVRACDELRQREVLRLVRSGRGGSKILTLMPEHRS